MLRKLWLYAAAATAMLLGMAHLADAQTGVVFTPRNLLICGDADNCPNQRGTTNINGDIAGSGTMTLDGWEAIGGASSTIDISVVTLPAAVNSYTNGMKFQRKSANANTAVVHLGQVVESTDAQSAQGKTVCFQYIVEAASLVGGTGFSANNALLNATVYAGTGTNEGYASMIAATWTGQTTVTTLPATVTTQGQLVANGCGTVPQGANEIGVDFSFTPVGTAGASDFVVLTGIQLETIAPGTPIASTNYEHLTAWMQLQRAQRRAYVINEPAAGVDVSIAGTATSATNCRLTIPFPEPMRAAPTLTASTITSGTTWQALAAGAAANLSAIATATANTKSNATVNLTTAGMTAGQACGLEGKGGSATLTWSADITWLEPANRNEQLAEIG